MLGKRIRDIAIDEKTSSQTIDQRHIQAKKSIAKRLQQRELWLKIRGMLEYKSVRDYDVCYLFFGAGYPRKIIAKIMRLHVSTVIKIIRKKYNELGDLA
jgi:DNA-directed RNA polymerase specialized sigma54-like protein